MTSISIIAIVPIDVWTTLNGGDSKSVFIMWGICYWCGSRAVRWAGLWHLCHAINGHCVTPPVMHRHLVSGWAQGNPAAYLVPHPNQPGLLRCWRLHIPWEVSAADHPCYCAALHCLALCAVPYGNPWVCHIVFNPWVIQSLLGSKVSATPPHCLVSMGVPCRCARLGSSIKHNLTYYLSIAAAGVVGIGLLLISGRLHAGDLLPLAMLLSNTYGVRLPVPSCGMSSTEPPGNSCPRHLLHCCKPRSTDGLNAASDVVRTWSMEAYGGLSKCFCGSVSPLFVQGS